MDVTEFLEYNKYQSSYTNYICPICKKGTIELVTVWQHFKCTNCNENFTKLTRTPPKPKL